jgi:glycosyltransferase involved in cell wall biosynthesis
MREMSTALASAGMHILVATTDDDGPGRHRKFPLGVPVQGGDGLTIYFSKWLDFYKVAPGLAWWMIFNVRRFDVVHIHALFSFTSIAAALVARWKHVPYVIRPLGTLSHYGVTRRRPLLKRLSLLLLERRILRDASAVHFTSRLEQDEADALGIRMRGVVIPLGIQPPDPGDGASPTAHFPSLEHARYVLFLSRLDPKKNVEALLRAFVRVRASHPAVKLLVAGGGAPAYVSALHALAHQLGLSDAVCWAGHIEGTRKAIALLGAEVFVLPSFSENFGIAAVEALMAGRPCVLARGVAIAQEVADAGAGVLVEPTTDSIAMALANLLQDAPARSAMSARAAELGRTQYSAQAMAAKLLKLYEEVRNP